MEVQDQSIEAAKEFFFTQFDYILAYCALYNVHPITHQAGTLFIRAISDLVFAVGAIETEKILSSIPPEMRLLMAFHLNSLTREPYLSST